MKKGIWRRSDKWVVILDSMFREGFIDIMIFKRRF